MEINIRKMIRKSITLTNNNKLQDILSKTLKPYQIWYGKMKQGIVYKATVSKQNACSILPLFASVKRLATKE